MESVATPGSTCKRLWLKTSQNHLLFISRNISYILLSSLHIISSYYDVLFILPDFHLSMPSMWANLMFLQSIKEILLYNCNICNGKRHRLALCCCCKLFQFNVIKARNDPCAKLLWSSLCVCVCLYWPTRPEILWLNVEWQKMTKRSPSCQWKRNSAQQRQEIEGRCSHLFRLSCLQKRIFHHLQPSNRRRCCRSQCLAAVEVLSAPSKRGHPAMDGPTSELKSNNVDQSTTPWKSSNWFKLTVELDIDGSWTRPGHLWSCSG